MKVIQNEIQLSAYSSKLYRMYFEEKTFAVFDIETTGLSPANSKVILSGLVTRAKEGDGMLVRQFFADQNDDEESLIQATADALREVDFVITYNGCHFDMPYMEKRAKKYGIEFPKPYNLDLYLLVSGYAPFKTALPGLRQKDIEFYMGLADSRDDLISGKESVDLYHRYMEMKSFALEQKILLHNHDDILQLTKLLPIIETLDFHRAMYKRGFPAGRFLIEKIQLKGRELRVTARQLTDAADYIVFPTEQQPYSLTMDSSSGACVLSVPTECAAGALYVDALTILGDAFSAVSAYPAAADGYLILSQDSRVNEMEVNAFVKAFFKSEVWK